MVVVLVKLFSLQLVSELVDPRVVMSDAVMEPY